MSMLLTRDEFREQIFTRDGHKCVICKSSINIVAHHIIDRSLFGESHGYFLNNGVSLCEGHHIEAEQTTISCDELRFKAGITEIILPEHFELENFESIEIYDHWGNIVLPTGIRIKGELFHQDNVQKVLAQAGCLKSFLDYVKYPRTYHALWSPNVGRDDRVHSGDSMKKFLNRNLIVTIKLDGENSNLYPKYYHARSINSAHHESRSWIKSFHARIAHDIPKDWRLCGENMFAKHSIHYKHLKSYFYLFSIWNEKNICLSWADTVEWANLLGIQTVPVMSFCSFGQISEMENYLENAFEDYCKYSPDECEGYVIRIADSFPYRDFRNYTAKVVRKDHVQTEANWMMQAVVPNKIEV